MPPPPKKKKEKKLAYVRWQIKYFTFWCVILGKSIFW